MHETHWHQYIPVTEREIVLGTYLTSIGWQNAPYGETYPPKGHPSVYSFTWDVGRVLPEFAVVFLEQGRGEVEWEQSHENLLSGDVLFIPPGEWHRYRPQIDTGWRVRWLCFNGETMLRLRNLRYLPDRLTVMRGADNHAVRETFDRLTTAILASAHADLLVLAGLTMEVIGSLLENVSPAEKSAIPESAGTVLRALDFIWNNSHRSISVMDVAKAVRISRRTLERQILAEKGVSLLAFIRSVRVERAKSQLLGTRLSVKEIAHLSGYADVRGFIRMFSQECGISPGKWRTRECSVPRVR